jgi:replicative DNA helicase
VKGLKRGELGVLQSQRSSAGKSAALAFLARQFGFQGKKILIYTLEMSEEEYEDRLDMCIAGLQVDDLIDSSKIINNLRRLVLRGGNIFIKQFPGSMTTVSDLRKHKLLLEQTHGFHADVVLVDYGDELSPEKRSYASNSFEVGKEIYSHLRGWAVKEDVAIWTGMQSNRGAGDVVEADMEHSGESIAKAWIADLIFSINRTAKEQEEGITRLRVVKRRTGKARFTIKFRTDFDRMLFVVPEWRP